MLKALLLALLLSAMTAVAGARTEIPFKFVDGFIIVSAQAGPSGKPLSLLLDSGASSSVLSLEAAQRLRLPLLAPEPVMGVGTRTTAYHIPPVKASSGKMRLTEIPLALDLSNAASLCRHPVDGLLGTDFFAGRIVQIDYKARKIRFLANADSDSTAIRLPLRVRNGVLCVPVGVNGSGTRWTRLDTGCNDALHWVTGRGTSSSRQTDGSVGFMTDASRTFRASVQLGNHTLGSVEVAPHNHPLFPGEAGLLGNGILSRYAVTIDTRNRQMLLHNLSPSGR